MWRGLCEHKVEVGVSCSEVARAGDMLQEPQGHSRALAQLRKNAEG